MSSSSARSAVGAVLRRQLAAPKSAPARRWLSASAHSLRLARPSSQRFASTLRDIDTSDPGIQVSEIQSSSGAPETPEEEAARSVFVGRLSFNVDHAWLREEFESVGEIVSARIITDRDGGSRGFGYVEFKDKATADKAMDYDGKEIDGRAIRLDKATPRPARTQGYPREGGSGVAAHRPAATLPPSSTLYLGNLSFNATESQLREAFAPTDPDDAPIVSIRIPVDGMTGRPRGFGYVEYGDVATATRVHERFHANPQLLDGREPRVGYSTPRNTFAARRDGAGDSAPYGSRGGPAISRGSRNQGGRPFDSRGNMRGRYESRDRYDD